MAQKRRLLLEEREAALKGRKPRGDGYPKPILRWTAGNPYIFKLDRVKTILAEKQVYEYLGAYAKWRAERPGKRYRDDLLTATQRKRLSMGQMQKLIEIDNRFK